jgi:hypothetical protein
MRGRGGQHVEHSPSCPCGTSRRSYFDEHPCKLIARPNVVGCSTGRRLYFQTAPHDSREAAATAAFKSGPACATTCCTLLASQGNNGNWQLNDFYIRWHRRDDLPAVGECRDPDELATDRRNESHGDKP